MAEHTIDKAYQTSYLCDFPRVQLAILSQLSDAPLSAGCHNILISWRCLGKYIWYQKVVCFTRLYRGGWLEAEA